MSIVPDPGSPMCPKCGTLIHLERPLWGNNQMTKLTATGTCHKCGTGVDVKAEVKYTEVKVRK